MSSGTWPSGSETGSFQIWKSKQDRKQREFYESEVGPIGTSFSARAKFWQARLSCRLVQHRPKTGLFWLVT